MAYTKPWCYLEDLFSAKKYTVIPAYTVLCSDVLLFVTAA
jgi:hypothetical protein